MIHRPGCVFTVDPAGLEEGESIKKMFVGSVSINKQGVVTHLWLRAPDDSVDTGYSVESITPVR